MMTGMSQKTVLIMSLSQPNKDPRPYRTIQLLKKKGYMVDVLSYTFKDTLGVNKKYLITSPPKNIILKVYRKLLAYCAMIAHQLPLNSTVHDKINNFMYGVNNIKGQLSSCSYRLIIVEDLALLPLAFQIKAAAAIIFDAREYYPAQQDQSWFFRFFEKKERIRLCNAYLHKCNKVITVSKGLLEAYKKEFNVDSCLIMSAPDYHQIKPQITYSDRLRMVHHGVANENRQLENMIKIVDKLDGRFFLDFYLTGSKGYIKKLKRIAQHNKRIRFKEPVAFSQIIPTLSKYDIGIFYVEPSTYNLLHCLPNKFFEFIQARLAIITGPSPQMASLILEYELGVSSKKFSTDEVANMLNLISVDDINRFKKNSNLCAARLSSEVEMAKYSKMIDSVAGQA